ncbi:Uncharacterised protein [uncultured archaeon]|nr:Uncharacterised protein [uncultured archaeon]
MNYNDTLRRFRTMVGRDSFLRDLQICKDPESWIDYDPEAMSEDFVKRAENGNYLENDCNYRFFKWVKKAINMSEWLSGLRGGNIPKEKLYESVRTFDPEYDKADITYKDAADALKKEVKKAIRRSIEAKKQFLISPENARLCADTRPFFEGSEISDVQLARVFWAYGEGFKEIYKEHAINRTTVNAIFEAYPEFCYDGARAALEDSLKQYNEVLLKLKTAVIADKAVKALAEAGKAEKDELSKQSMDSIKALYLKALEFDSAIELALIDAYTHPEIRAMKNSKAEDAEFTGFSENPVLESCKNEFTQRRKEFREKMRALEDFEKSIADTEPSVEERQEYFGMLEEIQSLGQGYRSAEDSIENHYKKIEETCPVSVLVPLVLEFSKKNADALMPVDTEAPRVEAINWEESNRGAIEAYSEVMELLAKNGRELDSIVKQFSKYYLFDVPQKQKKDFGFLNFQH